MSARRQQYVMLEALEEKGKEDDALVSFVYEYVIKTATEAEIEQPTYQVLLIAINFHGCWTLPLSFKKSKQTFFIFS